MVFIFIWFTIFTWFAIWYVIGDKEDIFLFPILIEPDPQCNDNWGWIFILIGEDAEAALVSNWTDLNRKRLELQPQNCTTANLMSIFRFILKYFSQIFQNKSNYKPQNRLDPFNFDQIIEMFFFNAYKTSRLIISDFINFQKSRV